MDPVQHEPNARPECRACGKAIYGNEEYRLRACPAVPDRRHVYPNGEQAPTPIWSQILVPGDYAVFGGRDLLHETGHFTGPLHITLLSDMFETLRALSSHPTGSADAAHDAERRWIDHVVAPIVRALVLPKITADYQVALHEECNPIRVTTLDGRDATTLGQYAQAAALGDAWVSVPEASLPHLAVHYTATVGAGVPEGIAVPALLAGLTSDEAATRHADGTLDPNAIAMLRALKG